MLNSLDRGARLRGTLLLADISGYTGFLHGVAEAHSFLTVDTDEPPQAYALVSSLLDVMVEAVEPPFRLVKFEGDALFAVSDEPVTTLRGPGLIDCLRVCHAAFGARLAAAGAEWTCRCNSCTRIGDLSLKFVLHHGEYIVTRIAGREELAGPEVIAAHRLLKNHVRELIGARPYALLTDAALAALDVPSDGMVATSESYDDLPPIPVHVLALA
jgi:hypothetical protein